MPGTRITTYTSDGFAYHWSVPRYEDVPDDTIVSADARLIAAAIIIAAILLALTWAWGELRAGDDDWQVPVGIAAAAVAIGALVSLVVA